MNRMLSQRTLRYADASIEYRRWETLVLLEHDLGTYPLTATWADTIYVFEYQHRLYVLGVNLKSPSLRLDLFTGQQSEPIGSLVINEQAQIEAILGLKWRKVSPRSMAVLLANELTRKEGVV